MNREGFGKKLGDAAAGLATVSPGLGDRLRGLAATDSEIPALGPQASGVGLVVHIRLDAIRAIKAGGDLPAIGKPNGKTVAISPWSLDKSAIAESLKSGLRAQARNSENEKADRASEDSHTANGEWNGRFVKWD